MKRSFPSFSPPLRFSYISLERRNWMLQHSRRILVLLNRCTILKEKARRRCPLISFLHRFTCYFSMDRIRIIVDEIEFRHIEQCLNKLEDRWSTLSRLDRVYTSGLIDRFRGRTSRGFAVTRRTTPAVSILIYRRIDLLPFSLSFWMSARRFDREWSIPSFTIDESSNSNVHRSWRRTVFIRFLRSYRGSEIDMLSFIEFHSWLNIRPIEILFILLGWLIFSLLFVLRFDFHFYSLSWFQLFLPLFVMDGIHLYFILIILIRIWLEHKQRIGLTSAYACRLILQKLFVHLPLILCSIVFHYFLFKALLLRPILSTQPFVHCLVPVYLLIGWMFLKIFICKKQNHTTIIVQS